MITSLRVQANLLLAICPVLVSRPAPAQTCSESQDTGFPTGTYAVFVFVEPGLSTIAVGNGLDVWNNGCGNSDAHRYPIFCGIKFVLDESLPRR